MSFRDSLRYCAEPVVVPGRSLKLPTRPPPQLVCSFRVVPLVPVGSRVMPRLPSVNWAAGGGAPAVDLARGLPPRPAGGRALGGDLRRPPPTRHARRPPAGRDHGPLPPPRAS